MYVPILTLTKWLWTCFENMAKEILFFRLQNHCLMRSISHSKHFMHIFFEIVCILSHLQAWASSIFRQIRSLLYVHSSTIVWQYTYWRLWNRSCKGKLVAYVVVMYLSCEQYFTLYSTNLYMHVVDPIGGVSKPRFLHGERCTKENARTLCRQF